VDNYLNDEKKTINMKVAWIFICILLLSLAGLTGCISLPSGGSGGEGTPTTTRGVKATQVSEVILVSNVTPSVVYENSVATLTAKIENHGSEVAKNAFIQATRISGDITIDNENPISLGDIEKPIKGKPIPSYQSWSLTAGTRSGDVKITLKYDYLTWAAGDVQIYDLDKLKTDEKLMNEAQSSAGILSFDGSKAPLKISINDNGPFYYTTTHTSDKLILSIENAGSGRVIDNKVKATIKIGDTYCKNGETIDLRFVGSTDVICDFTLPKPSDYKTSVLLDVKLEYTYEVSSTQHIEITKL
jgi:hypothetical protein